MSDTTPPTTAASLIAFYDELAASSIPAEAVQAMVVDASRLVIQNDPGFGTALIVKAGPADA